MGSNPIFAPIMISQNHMQARGFTQNGYAHDIEVVFRAVLNPYSGFLIFKTCLKKGKQYWFSGTVCIR